ncbi:UNKNOWN [Stylonychia lemnae]|uniref:Uncharacterized protein n=1 Tax=Stylonychia lemnae TaxID=5949 RepID=A0A078AGA5_STYLE|nr:UNKNOWN [Stylonychia lemnae]|eukprot:CDW81264.1 UNKNOWN [Stylonychia lemnae]
MNYGYPADIQQYYYNSSPMIQQQMLKDDPQLLQKFQLMNQYAQRRHHEEEKKHHSGIQMKQRSGASTNGRPKNSQYSVEKSQKPKKNSGNSYNAVGRPGKSTNY